MIIIGCKKTRHYRFIAMEYTLEERKTICGTNSSLFSEKLMEKKILCRPFLSLFHLKKPLKEEKILKSGNISVSGAPV